MKKGESTVTQEIFDSMVDLRQAGASYPEIMQTLAVSKWKCQHYLRGVKVDKHFVQKEWEKAERQAKEVLANLGFSHILDLNKISVSPHWDYYAEKGKQRWLVDVTIDKRKDVVGKILHTVGGLKHAILLKENDRWKWIELNFIEQEIK